MTYADYAAIRPDYRSRKFLHKVAIQLINIRKNLLVQALDEVNLAIVVFRQLRRTTEILFVNAAFEARTGMESSSLMGAPAESLLEGSKAVLPSLREFEGPQTLVLPGNLSMLLQPLHERPGRPGIWLLSELFAAGDDKEGTESEELQRAQTRIRQLERIDTGTGLLNRRAFEEIYQRDWLIARREQRRMAMLMFRVDALSGYQTLLGTHATDDSMGKIAHAIANSLHRGGDTVARFGEDEFAALVGSLEQEEAAALAARIAARVEELCIHHPRSAVSRYMTVSWGVASCVPATRFDVSPL